MVVGSEGSIGKRRARLLEEMGHRIVRKDIKNHDVVDIDTIKDVDAAFICVPPTSSVDVATFFQTANIPYFLEKPGAVNFRQFLPLSAQAVKSDLVTMVACNIRFTSEYRAIEDALPNIGKPLFTYAEFGYYLPYWREGSYNTYYSCYKVSGGGILMDSIHELDYMFSLFGYPDAPIALVHDQENTKELEHMEAEDTANVFIMYRNRLNMMIHLDYLQRSYKRVFFAIGTKGRIDQTFNVQGNNEMYRREMTHFLDCVKKGNRTCKPVEQHGRLLEFIDHILPEGK